MQIIDNKSKELLSHIDGSLNYLSTASLHFREAMQDYLGKRMDKFEERRKEVNELERKADDMLKEVKYELYAYMLIPDTRGDVYKLMDDLDDVIDFIKDVLLELSIEKPDFPDFLREDYNRLSEYSAKAVSALVKAVRAFFSQIKAVDDQVNKVIFYEKEADKLEEAIRRQIFENSELTDLALKTQYRRFTERITRISDISEDIAKNVLIYAIKRKI